MNRRQGSAISAGAGYNAIGQVHVEMKPISTKWKEDRLPLYREDNLEFGNTNQAHSYVSSSDDSENEVPNILQASMGTQCSNASFASTVTYSTTCSSGADNHMEVGDVPEETPLLPAKDDNDLEYEFGLTQSRQKLYSVEDCFNDSKRLIKTVVAIGLFCIVLICVIVSKGSLLFISSQMNKYVSFKRTGLYNETYIPDLHNYSDLNIPLSGHLVANNSGHLFLANMTDRLEYITVTSINNHTGFSMPVTRDGETTSSDHIDCAAGPGGQCEQCGVPVCLEEVDDLCSQKETVRWIWSMFLCQCVPYFIMFLRCFWKIGFKKKTNPSLGVFSAVGLIEAMYTVGLFLLLYVLLPQLDATRGMLLFTGTAFVPSLLKMINRPRNETKQYLKILLDVLAFLGQASALVAWVVIRIYHGDVGNEYYEDLTAVCAAPETTTVMPVLTTAMDDNNGTTLNNYTFSALQTTESFTTSHNNASSSIIYEFRQVGILPESWNDIILIPVVLILVSLGYWENFFDAASKFGKIGKTLNKLRQSHWQASTKIYLGISLFKILLTFLLIVIYHAYWDNSIDLDMLFDSNMFYDNKCNHLNEIDNHGSFQSDWLEVAAIQISMGVICFYVSDLAIKGQMQLVSFTLPLLLSTPVSFVLLYWACVDCYNGWQFGTTYYWNCYAGHNNYSELMIERYAWIGVIWWLSFLLLTRYLANPKIERLAKLDRIFTYPVPEGAMLEQALMLNRRRNDHEKFRKKDKLPKQKTEKQLKAEKLKAEKRASMQQEKIRIMDEDKKQFSKLNVGHVATITEPEIPFIYMCATMWHENEKEMLQILKSLFRINEDQCAKQIAREYAGCTSIDYYKFEVHIFFDDAFEPHLPEEKYGYKVNDFVKMFIKIINKAASAILNQAYILSIPLMYETPYGGRMEWVFPKGENKLVMHLKDKQLIRNRKRWSQIMYLHRVLSLGIMDQPISTQRKKVLSENTFVLALDGDVDFKPEAVLLLLDLMKRNTKVAAACGRIHPIGNGPMVWYQKFEYSISHWLQKATEHVLGCVLCSPGCFSLFRASALMDDNVVQMYTTLPKRPIHHVQYDQGEDRWLCTLLLQQGYRVEYSAAADAYTYAPEEFNEFYNQRRRWITSTFANLLDLLKTGRRTANKNENISMLYIIYQGLLFAASILGPATIFMLVIGALQEAFTVDPMISFSVGLGILIVYMILCFKTKSSTQLKYAALLSVMFGVLQMLVIVGISQRMVNDGLCSPSSAFFLFVLGAFILCSILHPQEFFNLFHGFLYYLLVPSMYLLLIIYSLCNLHVVSWGTREVKQAPSEKQTSEMIDKQKEAEQLKKLSPVDQFKAMLNFTSTKNNESSSSASIGVDCLPCCLLKCCAHGEGRRNSVSEQIQVVNKLQELQKTQESVNAESLSSDKPPRHSDVVLNLESKLPEPDPKQLKWTDDEDLPQEPGSKQELDPYEERFWKIIIKKYLYPLDLSRKEKDEITQGLLDLRNKAVFSFFLIDVLLMVLVFGLSKSGLYIKWTCANGKESEIDPIGLSFVFVFGSVLALQVVGMLVHRLFTFLQIISTTFICGKKAPTVAGDEKVLDFVKELMRVDIDEDETANNSDDDCPPDYDSSDEEYDNFPHTKEAPNVAKKVTSKPKVLHHEEVNKMLAARCVALSAEVYGKRPSFQSDAYPAINELEPDYEGADSAMADFKARGKELINESKIQQWGERAELSHSDMRKGQATLRKLAFKHGKPEFHQQYFSSDQFRVPWQNKPVFARKTYVPVMKKTRTSLWDKSTSLFENNLVND